MRPAAETSLVSELFVRGLGLIYTCAFVSLAVQVVGLIGERGIRPAALLLSAAKQNLGAWTVVELPSWFLWTGVSDVLLRGACWLGACCGLSVALGYAPRIMLFLAWSLYLSVSCVADVFCSYQWDTLLLEAGVVAWFVATPTPRRCALGLWLARALCFKLMLLSGLAKVSSGDSTWRDFTALSFHWWTQPLPAWTAVWVGALPVAVQKAMTASALAIELIVPFGVFGPRRVRLTAAALLALLQLMIAATGSYGFFNLLSLLLCAALLDDAALPARMMTAFSRLRVRRARAWSRARQRVFVVCSYGLLTCSALIALQRFLPLPELVSAVLDLTRPLRSVNNYGLFAVMTTERREIALEGSADGVSWRRYGFRWKPDALDRRPRFVEPHMPRLDWQMWFAGLGRCERQAWFHAFLARVLEGSPDVLGLMAYNPFPDAPPRYLRTPSALYRFAPLAEAGVWWTREPISDYCPPVMLRDGKLVRAPL